MFRQPICNSIEKRTVLFLTYQDEAREVEPHILGVSRAGNLVMSGWQRSGERPGWRNFLVPEIEELNRTAIRFAARESYNSEDSTFERVICRIEASGALRPARAER